MTDSNGSPPFKIAPDVQHLLHKSKQSRELKDFITNQLQERINLICDMLPDQGDVSSLIADSLEGLAARIRARIEEAKRKERQK